MPRFRYGRDYAAIIGIGRDAVIIRPPLRISFEAEKSISGGLNRLTAEFYGLGRDTREAMAKDPEDPVYIPLQLSVGYSGQLRGIFRGSIHVGETRRDGASVITTVECLDGGFDFQRAYTTRTVTNRSAAIDEILRDMEHTAPGAIPARRDLPRPKVMVGPSTDQIAAMLDPDEEWFIDDERLNILGPNQVVEDTVALVSAATGMLDTPTREQKRISVTTQFNPLVRLGGMIQVESDLAPHMNGVYRTEQIGYTGDTHGEPWQMEATGSPVFSPEVIR